MRAARIENLDADGEKLLDLSSVQGSTLKVQGSTQNPSFRLN